LAQAAAAEAFSRRVLEDRESPTTHKEVLMVCKPKELPASPTKTNEVKQIAAQLAGKSSTTKDKTWTKSFAASGAKVGGKVGT
jgi:hypothetical protein